MECDPYTFKIVSFLRNASYTDSVMSGSDTVISLEFYSIVSTPWSSSEHDIITEPIFLLILGFLNGFCGSSSTITLLM